MSELPGGTETTGAIILAAGAGSRMGRLKQLLPYGGVALVRHAAEQARQAGFRPIIVVVGAEAEQVRASLSGLPVAIAENAEWRLGMGSSIVCGVRRLAEAAHDTGAVAIVLADQPLVTAEHLRRMRGALVHNAAAVAAEYGGSVGVPAIFKRNTFSALRSLPVEAGAKQMLRGLNVVRFPLPEAAEDIDTLEDYERLTS